MDNTINVKNYVIPNFINKKVESVKTTLDSQGIRYSFIGEGNKVVKQFPNKGNSISLGDTIYLITNDSNIKVPNVVGMSSTVAKEILQSLGIKVNLDGVGYVVSQSVSEGTDINEGLEITLNLAPKFAAE